jgi:hypothetical protein
MKTASAKEVRDDLKHRTHQELMDIVLRLSRFKKENKELLTYLLFESEYEEGYIDSVKIFMSQNLEKLESKTGYHQKKRVRKVLRDTKKYIRYSGNKETEVILLTHFCKILIQDYPHLMRLKVVRDVVHRQMLLARVRLSTLHEDLQYDYERELDLLE